MDVHGQRAERHQEHGGDRAPSLLSCEVRGFLMEEEGSVGNCKK